LDRSGPKPFAARRSRALAGVLEALWARGVCDRPTFERMRERAVATAALVGDGPWREAHDRLIDSLAAEADLNPVGLTFAHVQLGRLLRQRERAYRLWRDNPAIAATPVPCPIIVLGQMRSGTTRLRGMPGWDPRLNPPPFFQGRTPLPASPDLRLLECWAQLKLLGLLNPEIQAVHPTSPRAVEEPFGLLGFSFYGAQFEAQWRVPGFARWWEGQDRAWVYQEFRQLPQTIAWRRGASGAPWVLKAPQFMEDLEDLLSVLPDVRLVCLHREPDAVVASTASLVWHQMQVQSDTVDRHWIGGEWLRKTAWREGRADAVRRARLDVPQIDVEFSAMNRDWRREIRRIYRFLGLELPSTVERRMERFLLESEASGFRRHRYRSSDFGLHADAAYRALRQARLAD